MAITAQEHITPESPGPSRSARPQRVSWPKPSQLRRSLPILRLLAEIWSIPHVKKIGILVDESGTQVRVLIAEEDRSARSRIYAAERDYLNATAPHHFSLWVSPISRAGSSMPLPFETVVER